MNNWRSRISCALVMLFALEAHAFATESLPNSPCGMLLFHGSAALVDLFLLYMTPAILVGRLSDVTQTLNLVSMCVNFVGWIAYMAYAPPIFYNTISWGLSYVQWGILFFMDRRDDHRLGFYLVRGRNFEGTKHYLTETNQ